jgi:hypothetical protein
MLSMSRNVGMVLGLGLAGAVLTTLLDRNHAYIEAVQSGLHVATIAAVLGGLASLARPKHEDTAET